MTDGIRTFEAAAAAAAFPLGGIGTGNVSLGARGDLRDWEIFNRPAKGLALPNTFFAIRVRAGDAPPVARVLEGRIPPPHTLSHGYHPMTAAGLPRLERATLRGEYPIAWIDFADPRLPVQVQLEAYTPFVPLNPADSGIPCAILTYTVTNISDQPVDVTIAGSLANPIGEITRDRFGNLAPGDLGKNSNAYLDAGAVRGLFLTSQQYQPDSRFYGDMSLVTDHADVTYKRAWLRGAWFDYLQEFWDDFVEDGRLSDLGYSEPSDIGKTDTASLGLLATLAPGESRPFRFILAWSFPNRPNSWDTADAPLIRNRYAVRFDNSWQTAQYVLRELPRLARATRTFHDALFSSTLPAEVLDAVSANIVPLRSTTCFWLEDGRFFGWEGCFDDQGCCAGSCTHVWSYAHTLAFLFPELEREMRRIEFMIETEPDGYMTFRTFKTFGDEFIWMWGDQQPEAASDGQMGCLLRAYREWQLSADEEWLRLVWPGITRAIAYAERHWDTDGDGVPDGRQHNTYDIEFYGPNPLSAIYYLGGLRATEELARVIGDAELAERCRRAFERASARTDELLWNGEYFIQRIDDVDRYKYQHGAGCLSDQLLGQLHARVLGLGDLLPAAHVRRAIKAIFDHNFRPDFSEHVNCQRAYVLNDEAGLLMCSWPGGGRPKLPFVYSDEVWTGTEYQVAAHLIYEGWVEQGLTIVRAVRERHDGVRRNPWDEVECGHHYARSMSSWALLLALSGFHCDLGRGILSFEPVEAMLTGDSFSTFWSCGRGWGTYTQTRSADGSWQPSLNVLGGSLEGVRVSACGKEWVL